MARGLYYRQNKPVNAQVFRVRADRLLEGDYLLSLRLRVRLVVESADGQSVHVYTSRGQVTWPAQKTVQIIHNH